MLRTQHAGNLELYPWDITYFLALNTRIPPFDNVRARRALNFAVDRARLLDLAFGQGIGQVACQVLPPNLLGYRRYCPYTTDPNESGAWSAPDLARARQLVRASGTEGDAVSVGVPPEPSVGKAAGRYVVSVLNSLGYTARLARTADPIDNEDRLHLGAIFSGWYPDYAAPTGMVVALSCAGYNADNSLNLNAAEFCDHAIDREIARARSLQTSDPQAAAALWAKVDRDLTDEAPWVAFADGVTVDVKSDKVGNYQYNPQWGTLLDQLWVR
jgi:peptide/nickel transport system substrate-binding protein